MKQIVVRIIRTITLRILGLIEGKMPKNPLQGDVQYAPNPLQGADKPDIMSVMDKPVTSMNMRAFIQELRNAPPNVYGPRQRGLTPETQAAWESYQQMDLPSYGLISPDIRGKVNEYAPANLRAAATSGIGWNEPIESSWFTPEQLDYMGRMRAYNLHPQQYHQQPEMDPYGGQLPSWNETPDYIYQSYTNPAVSTSPFSTGGWYEAPELKGQGPRLRNTDIFGNVDREVNVVLPNYNGPFPSSYSNPQRSLWK
jgi:hypothetical protein